MFQKMMYSIQNKHGLLDIILYYTILMFKTCGRKPSENMVGKGQYAGDQHFLPFTHFFLIFLEISLLHLIRNNISSDDWKKKKT